MPTQNGRAIPAWYAEDDRSRIEEAAVLAGYKHLSAYIRVERQDLLDRLAELERSQKATHAMLAMLLVLIRKKATKGEVNELVAAGEYAEMPGDLLATAVPELAKLMRRFQESLFLVSPYGKLSVRD
jgi:hypothetical protein